jgi:hypothetical protein
MVVTGVQRARQRHGVNVWNVNTLLYLSASLGLVVLIGSWCDNVGSLGLAGCQPEGD